MNSLGVVLISVLLLGAGSLSVGISDSIAKCEDPGRPVNGHRRVISAAGIDRERELFVWSRVRFWCKEGYRLRGERELECRPSLVDDGAGQWSAPLSICVPHYNLRRTEDGRGLHWIARRTSECTDFGHPQNGVRTLLDNSINSGSIVTFDCDRGFELEGSKRLTCRQGNWGGPWPTCTPSMERAMCGDPGRIFALFGDRFVQGTREGATVTYSCARGLALVDGDETRTCLSSGEWSGQLPRCRVVNCGRPPAPLNGAVDSTNLGYGYTATYTCNAGHVLEGERVVTCQANSRWSSGPPTCRAVACPNLPPPRNGFVNHPRPAMYQSRASYGCLAGHGLVGTESRDCLPTGEWSGNQPTCQPGQCDELQKPQNGEVFYTSTNPGAIATYVCLYGYRTNGSPRRLCEDSGRWSGSAPSCESSSCSRITLSANVEVILTNENLVFSVATHSCHEGYRLHGNVKRECQPIGIWSGLIPSCIPIICPPVYPPNNGNITLSDRRCYGSEVVYTCNEGYTLAGGDMIRTCQETTLWSGREPCCIRDSVVCPSLREIANGRITFDGPLEEGTVASYSCASGFSLEGERERVCSERGVWSGAEPTCVRDVVVMCDVLADPPFGTVSHSGTSLGTTAQYTCNTGYDLSRDGTRTCLDTGMWSGNAPTCEPLICGPLVAPGNGNVMVGTTTFGSVATYTCDTSYRLVGTSSRQCQEDGSWSGETPSCEAIDCGSLTSPNNGAVGMSQGSLLGAVATYTCDTSYRLVGTSSRQCQEDGSWSGETPSCEAIDCGSLTAPNNGAVDMSQGSLLGAVATYTCDTSYRLVGTTSRECQEDGSWSGETPSCEAIDCGSLTAPNNGAVDMSQGSLLGAVATYTCDTSYRLVGTTSRECQEDGSWSGETPSCEAIDCGSLTSPNNGAVGMSQGSLLGAVATYTCDTSYRLVGTTSRECQEDGSWSGETPSCEAIDCGSLTAPNNGAVDMSEGSSLGAVATYTCDATHRLVGTSSRQCQDNGSWSGETPSCEAIDCGELETPLNGVVDTSQGSLVGAVATYTCDPTYTLIGSNSRQCQESGIWSGETPTCEAIDCGSLAAPNNGAVDMSQGSLLGAVATYTCDATYTLVGMDTRQCQEDGMWSEEAPTCEVVACPILEDPLFGSISYQNGNRAIGSTATYTCDARYSLVGDAVRTCLDTSEWSERAPTCELLECPSLPDPANGVVTVMDNVPGSFAMYICDSGYMLQGQGDRRCERVGEREAQWGGVPPTCTITMCPLLEDPDNGRVTTPPPYRVNSTAVYACDSGFESRNGSIRRVCMANGIWSSTEPVCVRSRVPCPSNLENPQFGTVEIRGDGTLGSTAVYSCELGYQVAGETAVRECQLNGLIGVWSGEEPICEAVMCPRLDEPVDGYLRITGLVVGAETVYFCDDGFRISGFLRRRCLATGEWNGEDTVCNPDPGTVSCGRLRNPDLGNVAHDSSVPGAVATYLCALGYVLVGGVRERRCLDNGTWDGNEPTCDVVNCGPLSDPTNGIVIVSLDTTLGTTAQYDCILGYELVGFSGEVRFCTVTGDWSETDPTCERVNCGPLSPPVNGVVDQLRGTRFMDETFYTCLDGYVLTPSDSQTRICTETGDWNGSDPTCELRASTVDCGSPPSIPNGEVSLLNSSTGRLALAGYSCSPGFMLVGESIRQCQTNSQWSGETPTCIRRQCPPLQAPRNGRIFLEGLGVGSSVTYLCDSGFQLVGLLRRVCRNSGEWNGEESQCLRMEDVMCHSLAPPTNGVVSGAEREQPVGSEASYNCSEGFSLEGSEQRRCQNNGVWSGAEPTCEPIQCPDPGVPREGRRLGDVFEVGRSVLFLCLDGFQLNGMSTLLCLANGTWSHPTPSCSLPATSNSRRRRGSCSGSGEEEILQSLGERCSCVAGQLVSCCRLRQEWSQLSLAQRQRYIAAVTTVSTDPLYRPAYIQIMQLYLQAFESVVLNEDPQTSLFFPWHRYYLNLYEDLLRMVDRSVTVPYWDWTLDAERQYESQVFDPVLGFGNTADNATRCVDSGPFREGEFHMTPQAGEGCVTRTYRNFPFFNRQLLDSILSVPASSFGQLHSALQLFFHFQIRCFVGGTMCTNFASEDPVYLLLLAQLDRLLDVWQSRDQHRAEVRYTDDATPLAPTLEGGAVFLKVSDYSSNKELPYATAVCYTEPPPVPASTAEPE